MIIVKLMGGLGNQMFQYAFGKYLALRHNTILKLDTQFLLDRTPRKSQHFVFRDFDLSVFNIDFKFASAEEVKKLRDRTNFPLLEKTLNNVIGTKKSYTIENGFKFSEKYLKIPNDSYIEGYWQSEKYFQEIESPLRNEFKFRNPLSERSRTLHDQIKGTHSVCINVRRGDFITNPVHGAMDVRYYRNCQEILDAKHEDLEYFIFSDDIEWCRENLHFFKRTTFVSHEYAGEKFQDYLQLMAACKHFVIPNSSFGWWAVWLSGEGDKTVIAPQKWFNDEAIDTNDLIPRTWLRM